MTGSNLLRRLVKLAGNSTEHCVKFLSLQICDDFVKPLHCQFTSLLATLSLPNPLGDLTATASVKTLSAPFLSVRRFRFPLTREARSWRRVQGHGIEGRLRRQAGWCNWRKQVGVGTQAHRHARRFLGDTGARRRVGLPADCRCNPHKFLRVAQSFAQVHLQVCSYTAPAVHIIPLRPPNYFLS
jgi:hypothetical protein